MKQMIITFFFAFCQYQIIAKTPDALNIVFILADDVGFHQIGAFGGGSFYETPNIDKLAEEGLKFVNAYAAAPVCSPTRGSIMTGKYPARTQLTVNIPTEQKSIKLHTPDFARSLSLSEITIAEILKEHGYSTGHFGKWHLNKDKNYEPCRPGDPESQGFDEVLHTEKPKNTDNSKGSDWHNTDLITSQALNFIDKNLNKPFFCYISFNAIHRPELERDFLINKYRAKPGANSDEEYGYNNPVQAAILETMDLAVGRISRHIDSIGISKNTLIVFFSDNGQLMSKKDAGVLRGSKADLYEGGIRMPLIFKWNGVIDAGTVSNELVISNDFYPTFCELAGIDKIPSNIDGLSLCSLFVNTEARLLREALFWHFPHYHHLGIEPQGAIRKGKYKLVENFEKSIYDEPDGWELFNLEEDPGERKNLIQDLPEIYEDLYNNLQQWRSSVGAQMMKINRNYKESVMD